MVAARARIALATGALTWIAGCASDGSTAERSPLGSPRYAIVCGKLLTVDAEDRILSPGMILVDGEHIAYVGEPVEIPAGYERLDCASGWAAPGMVDLHTHVQTGTWNDINDSVLPVNPELRASSALVPANPLVRRACAGGVTTLFGIPGSGTSMGGFGVIYKTKTSGTFEEVVVKDPGGLKVAQTHNPQRGSGDLGATWCGLSWLLEDVNDRTLAAAREGRFDPRLESLKRVLSGELPVLIHCAGTDGVASAARMWKGHYGTRCVVSHGCFDAHYVAPYVASLGVPVNHGPRTMDFYSTRTGEIVGTAKRYEDVGGPNLSLNTDSGIVPEEELFLQGSMSARLGADAYHMFRAVTINPAIVFGIQDRVGSLEKGKDADIVIYDGDPLDPRSRVDLVLIDGSIQYDRQRDGQWF